LEQVFQFHWPTRDRVLQSFAYQEFHGDEGSPIFLADVVNGADMCMVQGGGGLRFALEAREGLVIFGDIIGEEFEGDVAVEANVFGLVDNAHTSTTELLENAVVGDCLANERVGVRHSAAILGCDFIQVNESVRL
jgi:hypothetical protein